MITIRMNSEAASALQPLTGTGQAAPVNFDAGLRGKLAEGLKQKEDALVFAAHDGQWVGAPNSPIAAVVKMRWLDLTGYECNVNSFHLEDHAPGDVTIVNGGQPISHEEQIMLLRLGMAVAKAVIDLVEALPEPVHIRCVIGVNETNGTFRFHKVRRGEDWVNLHLDKHRSHFLASDMMVVVDSQP